MLQIPESMPIRYKITATMRCSPTKCETLYFGDWKSRFMNKKANQIGYYASSLSFFLGLVFILC